MSLTNNQYWNGDAHAVLSRETISADWGSGNHSGTRIDMANRAFCIYYHAKQALNDSATENHWTDMYNSLNDCATEGWGMGVDDLQEALDHIDQNNGRWTADNTENYYGGSGKSYNQGIISDAPQSCVNFLDAVDDKLPQMQEAMQVYQTKCQALQRLQLTQESSTDWEEIKNHIDTVKTSAERVKPLLWLVPAALEANIPRFSAGTTAAQRIDAFASGTTTRVNQAIKFLDVVGNIHDSLTVYVDATAAMGGDRRAGVAFASLSYAMTFLPILGGFYGTIIQKIPGLITNWREFMTNYHRRTLHPELHVRARREPAWRCEICNSSGGY